jgi:RNA polymerase sigma-70 factor, ECF subfamily
MSFGFSASQEHFRPNPPSPRQNSCTIRWFRTRKAAAESGGILPQLFDTARVLPCVEAMARTDVQLMLDVKAGDEQSFELLLRKYRSPLVNFLYRMVRDTAVAEELAQEVFLRVYRARQEYAPSAKFTTWMFRIATNLALNSMRDNRHRQMEISMDQSLDPGEDEARVLEVVADRAPNVEQELVARSRAQMILKAIHALPEKQRAAVLLHKYRELDYDEIARILECSESALKSLLFRAYETLRGELAPLVTNSVRF